LGHVGRNISKSTGDKRENGFFARPVCVQNRPGKTGATLSNTKTWSLRGHFSGAGN
jgi:hypothetical protein